MKFAHELEHDIDFAATCFQTTSSAFFRAHQIKPLTAGNKWKLKGQFIISKWMHLNSIEDGGVYCKATIIEVKGRKGGRDATVEYYFNGKSYSLTIGAPLGQAAVGRQFFIKVLPSNPRAIIFYHTKEVPSCLQDSSAPMEGWQVIPECD